MTHSGWCAATPPNARPQHERCRWGPCLCPCHLAREVGEMAQMAPVERVSGASTRYDMGSKTAPNQRELTGASQPLPTKDK